MLTTLEAHLQGSGKRALAPPPSQPPWSQSRPLLSQWKQKPLVDTGGLQVSSLQILHPEQVCTSSH